MWQHRGTRPQLNYGKALNNLGLFHSRTGAVGAAADYFERAAVAFVNIDHPQATRRRLTALTDAGVVLREAGDYTRSEEVLQRVMTDTTIEAYPTKYILAAQRLSDIYRSSGRYAAATGPLLEAMYRLEDLGQAHSPYAHSLRIDLANVYHEQGRYNDVETILSQLRMVYGQLSGEDGHRVRVLDLLNTTKRGVLTEAEARYLEALDNARASNADDYVVSVIQTNGGEVATLDGRLDEAERRTQLAVSLLLSRFTFSEEHVVPAREDLRNSRYPRRLFIHLGDLARVYESQGRLADALAALDAAAAVSDNLRNGLSDQGSQLFWREELRPLYERAINICAQINQPERAYDYFERARAILLLEGLLVSDRRANLPDSVANQLKTQEAQIADFRLSLVDNDSTYAQTADSLTHALATLDQLQQQVATNFPNTIRARTDVTTTPHQTFAQSLQLNEYATSIQYFYGQDTLYALTTEPGTGDLALHSLGPANELQTLIEQYVTKLANASSDQEEQREAARLSAQLYRQLLGKLPLADYGKLLIIPDGPLAFLPFAALIKDEAKPTYLIENYEVTYAQSATVWQYQLDKPAAAGPVIAFAPFTKQGRAEAPMLAASKREAAALADYFGGVTYEADQATGVVLMEHLPNAHILHLATHAYASRTDEVPPRILTADGAVNLRDIYGLTTKAELVTLSACNSNLGQDARGEGVLSLGRAFSAAGATGVVASLWPVNDQATASIMDKFYAFLSSSSTRPGALRAAQLAYLNDPAVPGYLKSPIYWAAFNYYGAPGNVSSATSPSIPAAGYLVIGGALLFGLLGALLGYLSRKRSKN